MNLADPPSDRLSPSPARDAVVELGQAPGLARLDGRLARAFNRLHDRRAVPLPLHVGGSDFMLRWVYDDDAGAPALPPLDVYRFRLGPHGGRLGLDLPAVAALLGEARPARIPRALRTVLVADALAPCADALARTTRLHFEWQPGEEPERALDPAIALRFRVDGNGWSGALQFDEPGVLDAFAPATTGAGAPAAAFDRLRLPLRFALGQTRLRLHEVRGIARGDIVAIEDWRAAGAAVVAEAAPAGQGGPRLVGLVEGSQITIQHTREHPMNSPADTPAGTAPQAAELAVDRLDAIEVTLRFEVGDLAISLGELRNVRAGHVFDLGQPLNRGPVRIVAHGNLLGKGTLVAVGDRLGVRVSEFAPGDL